MAVNPPESLTEYDSLEDALADARAELEDDDTVHLCRFPDMSDFCGNRHDMDHCPHCFHISADDKRANEFFVKIVQGGN